MSDFKPPSDKYLEKLKFISETIARIQETGIDVFIESPDTSLKAETEAQARLDIYWILPAALKTLESFTMPLHRWDMPDVFGPLLRIILFEINWGKLNNIKEVETFLYALAGERVWEWVKPLTLAAIGFPDGERLFEEQQLLDMMYGIERD